MKRALLGLVAGLPFALAAACSGQDSTNSGDHHPHQTAGSVGGGGAGGAIGMGGIAVSETASQSSVTTGAVGGGGGGVGGSGGNESTDGGDAGFDCYVLGEPGNCMETTMCSAMTMHASWPGFCPGAADIQCCIGDLTLLCDPSNMPTPNVGHTTEAPGEGGCPKGMLSVEDFCVDKYEASLVRADNGASWSPFFNPGTTQVIAVSVGGAVPQGYIDGIEAGEACTNAGKRLCSDTEWLRACQGPSGYTFPYGDTRMTGVCNDHRSVHPAEEYFGSTDSSVFSMIDNPCINQLPETVDLTGSNAGCITAEGAFDMMGNLHEWTADPNGTFRGGYYVDTVENGPGCLYATTAHDTSHWDYSTGFRCCADP